MCILNIRKLSPCTGEAHDGKKSADGMNGEPMPPPAARKASCSGHKVLEKAPALCNGLKLHGGGGERRDRAATINGAINQPLLKPTQSHSSVSSGSAGQNAHYAAEVYKENGSPVSVNHFPSLSSVHQAETINASGETCGLSG